MFNEVFVVKMPEILYIVGIEPKARGFWFNGSLVISSLVFDGAENRVKH
jgi:hypothetical protein